MLGSALPIATRMLPLLSWFVRKYPTVDLTLVFHPEGVDEAVLMLEDYNQKN
ncbi:hypothetical protein [Vibrio parahaemolyticus]|uniref:hypothetical protein n=1 Tax=Vibrio parahaemolyticus TaxID=670 RepID=UPI000A9BD14C|nr:hypothetical protein [Vibrio parahaemolyticus]